jgi:4-alpha-glucanotransferase
MAFPRSSGILLHISSLPSRFGIGDLGREAYSFAELLAGTGQRLWQILPLGPTGYVNSPYQCLSAFAGNPLFLSLDKLAEEGLLEDAELENAPVFPRESVDYGAVIKFKMPLLRKSFERFRRKASGEEQRQFELFCHRNASWLESYALFMALKDAHSLTAWNTWEEGLTRREAPIIERWKERLSSDIEYHQYLQYQFFRQWCELKTYCNGLGIRFIGDMPLFVALDSAEVWSHPEMFHLDESGKPTVVAGVPPDYFSKTGQLWGNPTYRWDVMAKDGYSWWVQRFRVLYQLVDIVKIDHFRGLEKHWEVPYGMTTAIHGRWVSGPGAAFFNALQQGLGAMPIIVEDLGTITPEVEALRETFGFPGMRVLQFAFDGDPKNIHLPHNYPRNCVVYTGTHDNNTIVGWFKGEDVEYTTQSKEERKREVQFALRYLGTQGHEINWDFIRLALMSVADVAIIPLQDVVGLGGEARMNVPGRAEGNWRWRFTFDAVSDEIKRRLKELTTIYGR